MLRVLVAALTVASARAYYEDTTYQPQCRGARLLASTDLEGSGVPEATAMLGSELNDQMLTLHDTFCHMRQNCREEDMVTEEAERTGLKMPGDGYSWVGVIVPGPSWSNRPFCCRMTQTKCGNANTNTEIDISVCDVARAMAENWEFFNVDSNGVVEQFSVNVMGKMHDVVNTRSSLTLTGAPDSDIFGAIDRSGETQSIDFDPRPQYRKTFDFFPRGNKRAEPPTTFQFQPPTFAELDQCPIDYDYTTSFIVQHVVAGTKSTDTTVQIQDATIFSNQFLASYSADSPDYPPPAAVLSDIDKLKAAYKTVVGVDLTRATIDSVIQPGTNDRVYLACSPFVQNIGVCMLYSPEAGTYDLFDTPYAIFDDERRLEVSIVTDFNSNTRAPAPKLACDELGDIATCCTAPGTFARRPCASAAKATKADDDDDTTNLIIIVSSSVGVVVLLVIIAVLVRNGRPAGTAGEKQSLMQGNAFNFNG